MNRGNAGGRRLGDGTRICSAIAALALCAGQVPGQEISTTQQATTAPNDSSQSIETYTRVIEKKGRSIALELASREFAPAEGIGPKVCLVGVAHIADRSFYLAVQRLLSEYDVVLYESVKPPGTGGAGGQTDDERIGSTRSAVEFVGGVIESFHTSKQSYPEDLAALRVFAVEQEPRMAGWLDVAMIDAWGAQIAYKRADDGLSYTLLSVGADGAPGGEALAADIVLDKTQLSDPLALSREDSIQGQLADALKLKFQLDALDYGRPNWRCSDMAVDQVSRELEARGIDFGPLGGTLAGTSFPAKVISFLLGMIRMADTFLEGAIADTFKVVMIEMLGDERMVERGIGQLGEGFAEVIVAQRNQVAVDDLKRIIEREPQVKSVAILYGAAHMNDFEMRLSEQLGYQPAETRWLPAMRVDFTQSAVSVEEVNRIRAMIKQMMRAR